MPGARSRARRRGGGPLLLWVAGAISLAVLVSAAVAIASAFVSSSEAPQARAHRSGDPREYELQLAEEAAREFYVLLLARRFEEAAQLATGAARDAQLNDEWARARDGARDPDLADAVDHAMRATLVSFDRAKIRATPDGSVELTARARILRDREHERTPWFRLRRDDRQVWLVEAYRP